MILGYGIFSFLIIGILYTITVYIGYQHGFGAAYTPWLNIPAADYYYWETFFCLPTFLLVCIVFSGTCYLIVRLFGDFIGFDQIFGMFCIALPVPMLLTMWLPESILMIGFPESKASEFGGFSGLPDWIDILRQLIGTCYPLVLTIIGIRLTQTVRWHTAILEPF